MRGNVVETLIGAIVVLVAGFFLFYAYRSAGVAQIGGYEVMAKFDRVDGLTIGSDVRMSGIKIGTITAQSLDAQTYRAVLRFTVNADVKLPDDSSAKIASSGLLGPNYLSVEPGGSEDNLRPGGEIKYTQGAVNLLDLIAQAIFSATGSSGAKDGAAKDGGANGAAASPPAPSSPAAAPQVAPQPMPAPPQPGVSVTVPIAPAPKPAN